MKPVLKSTKNQLLPRNATPWIGKPYGIGGSQFFGTTSGVENTPVVFVHGNNSHPYSWEPHFDVLLENGYIGDELWAVKLSRSNLTHDELSNQLEEFVAAVKQHTGANKISIVSHSLGVTVSRHWLEVYERYNSVEKFIGLAGANHGMSTCPPREVSKLLPSNNPCRPCAYFSDNSIQQTPLEQLNKDTETPGEVEYYTIRGSHDNLFKNNIDSPRLEGATENRKLDTDHMGTQQDAEAVQQTYEWLNR